MSRSSLHQPQLVHESVLISHLNSWRNTVIPRKPNGPSRYSNEINIKGFADECINNSGGNRAYFLAEIHRLRRRNQWKSEGTANNIHTMEPYHNRECVIHTSIERDIYLTDDSAS